MESNDHLRPKGMWKFSCQVGQLISARKWFQFPTSSPVLLSNRRRHPRATRVGYTTQMPFGIATILLFSQFFQSYTLNNRVDWSLQPWSGISLRAGKHCSKMRRRQLKLLHYLSPRMLGNFQIIKEDTVKSHDRLCSEETCHFLWIV